MESERRKTKFCKMTERDILSGLRRLFANNQYHLYNQYVMRSDWESDYLSLTTSDYIIEAEVKVSRSDFFADFKKPKHKFYKALLEKRSHLVENLGRDSYNGSTICSYKEGILRVEKGWRDKHWFYNTNLQHRVTTLKAPCTRIHIHELSKKYIPHRFYFAVPKGLVKPEEIPAYAGLIELNKIGELPVYIKKAPILHKNPIDPKFFRVLLDKYYYKYSHLITNV